MPAKVAQSFKIDPARSKIGFRVHHLLGTARGNFSKFSGTIIVDRQSVVWADPAADLTQKLNADMK